MQDQSSNIGKKFDEILKQRAERLNISREDASRTSGERPKYLVAAESRAKKLGISLNDVLERDLRRMQDSIYPGPNCLHTCEVEEFFEVGELKPERQAHLEECPGCFELLSTGSPPKKPGSHESVLKSSEPTKTSVARVLERLEAPLQCALPAASSSPFLGQWTPILATAAIIVLVVSWIGATQFLRFSLLFPSLPVGEIAFLADGEEALLFGEYLRATLQTEEPVFSWEDSVSLGLKPVAANFGDEGGDLKPIERAFGSTTLVLLESQVEQGDPEKVQLKVELVNAGEVKVQNFEDRSRDVQSIQEVALDADKWLRTQLGYAPIPPKKRETALASSLPSDNDATRLLLRGLASLQRFRPSEAAEYLKQSVNAQEHPRTYSALAEAWASLGDAKKVRAATESALRTAKRFHLSEPRQKTIEGRLFEAEANWLRAIETYSRLEESHPDGELGFRIARAYLATSDSRAALRKIEEMRETQLSDGLHARLYILEARAAEALTNYSLQEESAKKAISLSQELGARSVEAEGFLLLGKVTYQQGKPLEAGEHFKEAIVAFGKVHDRNGAARVLREQGRMNFSQGENKEAERLFDKALIEFQELGNKRGEATIKVDLGHLVANTNPDRAEDYYTRALEEFAEIGSHQGMARALVSRGDIHAVNGDWEDASEDYQAALKYSRKILDRYLQTIVLKNLGDLKLDRGRIHAARELYEEAISVRKEMGVPNLVASAHLSLARVLTYQDQLEAAKNHYKEASAIYESMGNRVGVEIVQVQRAHLLIADDDFLEAELDIRDALKTLREKDADTTAATFALENSLLEQGKYPEARLVLADLRGRKFTSGAALYLEIFQSLVDAPLNPTGSVENLEHLVQTLDESGMTLLSLETRVVLAETRLQYSDKEVAMSEFETITQDARLIGADLIERKAASLVLQASSST